PRQRGEQGQGGARHHHPASLGFSGAARPHTVTRAGVSPSSKGTSSTWKSTSKASSSPTTLSFSSLSRSTRQGGGGASGTPQPRSRKNVTDWPGPVDVGGMETACTWATSREEGLLLHRLDALLRLVPHVADVRVDRPGAEVLAGVRTEQRQQLGGVLLARRQP